MSVSGFLYLLGAVILLGVLGNFFFHKTRIPNPVILIVVGIFLGPVSGWLEPESFRTAAPYFGAIALILILFEGGLELDIRQAWRQARTATILGVVSYFATAAGISLLSTYLLGVELRQGVFYGLVLGGTSPAVILAFIHKLPVSKEVQTVFSLETVVSEVLTVALTILALDLVSAGPASSPARQAYFVFHIIWTGFALAIVAGWAWKWAMPYIEQLGLSHMLTFAILLLLFATSEVIHAEPAITILVFGLILENGHLLSEALEGRIPERLLQLIRFPAVQNKQVFSHIFGELTFLVRTFFFVLVGVIIDFKALPRAAWVAALVFVAYFSAVRWLITHLWPTDPNNPHSQVSKILGSAMVPRGLATAVVALMVSSRVPGLEMLAPVAFIVIVASNLVMTAQIIAKWPELSKFRPS